jgi:CheY-like chemotaxis protein
VWAGMRLEKRILIVDDDDPIRALLMTVLRRRAFRVDSARNGVDALERLATCRYALVVLDLMMPRMNGYEVLEHVGQMPSTTRPLVLVLTAGLEQRRFDTSFVIGTMQKPFDTRRRSAANSWRAVRTFRSGRARRRKKQTDELLACLLRLDAFP